MGFALPLCWVAHLIFFTSKMEKAWIANNFTTRLNTLYAGIAVKARVLVGTKKDNLLKDCLFGSKVGLDTAGSKQIEQDIMSILKQ